jgi:hypothetical protein
LAEAPASLSEQARARVWERAGPVLPRGCAATAACGARLAGERGRWAAVTKSAVGERLPVRVEWTRDAPKELPVPAWLEEARSVSAGRGALGTRARGAWVLAQPQRRAWARGLRQAWPERQVSLVGRVWRSDPSRP